jgi:hypothetical protein
MYKVSLNQDLTIFSVYDTDLYIDETITTYPITESEKDMIWHSGNMGLWQYKDGKVVESDNAPEIRKTQFNQEQKTNRQKAYMQFSDPLFMKYQRGDATKEQWEAKVAEIVAAFPYQE